MNADRRAHPRRTINRAYIAHLLSPTGSVASMAVPADVSRGGFRTDVAREYVAGGRLALAPQRPHPLSGRRFPFVVVWSRPAPGAEIGGAFTPEITDAESTALSSG